MSTMKLPKIDLSKVKPAFANYISSQRNGRFSQPTLFRGILFRSRLEAKWAIFFNLIGYSWEYEPDVCYYYTPDFLIRSPWYKPAYVEVKPTKYVPPSQLKRIKRLSEEYSDCNCFVIMGSPFSYTAIEVSSSLDSAWLICPQCNTISLRPDLPNSCYFCQTRSHRFRVYLNSSPSNHSSLYGLLLDNLKVAIKNEIKPF